MRVRIDKPGNDGLARTIDDDTTSGNFEPSADFLDFTIPYHDGYVFLAFRARSVNETNVFKYNHLLSPQESDRHGRHAAALSALGTTRIGMRRGESAERRLPYQA